MYVPQIIDCVLINCDFLCLAQSHKLPLYKAAAVDPVEGVAVAVWVAAGATHSKESFVLKVAPQLKLIQVLLTDIVTICYSDSWWCPKF